jgi:hypothetical protein
LLLLLLGTLRLLLLLVFLPLVLGMLLFVLRVRRTTDSEKQRQNGRAGDSNNFHRYYLHCC